jgi:hypothetical protein
MAGTLTITTLSDGTNSTSATNPIRGSARAWGYVVGSSGSVALTASYNISSITRTGAGTYYVDFTNALPDANYSVVGSTSIGLGIVNYCTFVQSGINASPYYQVQTASRFYYSTYVFGTGATDAAFTTFAVFD